MWLFDAVRARAIAALDRLVTQPVERIALARRFEIPGWTAAALLALARQDALAPAELAALGWETAAKLVAVRESIAYQGVGTCACTYCTAGHGPLVAGPNLGPNERLWAVNVGLLRPTYDFMPKIKEVFGAELL